MTPWKVPTKEFVEGETYTPRELEAFADQMLKDDRASSNEDHGILNDSQYAGRQRREIINQNGVPDPALFSGMYWRTHPEGRGVNSDEVRSSNGGSRGYYKQ